MSQQVCVSLQTERSIAAGCIRKHVGLYPLQCPAAQAMLATPGFPCVISLQSVLMLRDINHARQRDCLKFLLQLARSRNIASMGHNTIVNAGFF